MDIQITKTTAPKQKPDQNALGFGRYFTDHMFMMDYNPENGWHDARIVPFQNLSLSPAATVFHYGAEIFEGLKAYRRPDGQVQLFRPDQNFERMNNSAERLTLPQSTPLRATALARGSTTPAQRATCWTLACVPSPRA